MKCHYEVLNIPREASPAEIKTAYRRLALQWHPDKNLDNTVEAKEQFQLVQNAYKVLSDHQERAWYDNHREQLLRGAGSSYNDDSLDVFPYFTPSCYKGFGDDPQGFYAVYFEVFSKLAAEETDYLNDPEDVSQISKFGNSSTAYEDVHEFYAYWMSFSTSKRFKSLVDVVVCIWLFSLTRLSSYEAVHERQCFVSRPSIRQTFEQCGPESAGNLVNPHSRLHNIILTQALDKHSAEFLYCFCATRVSASLIIRLV